VIREKTAEFHADGQGQRDDGHGQKGGRFFPAPGTRSGRQQAGAFISAPGIKRSQGPILTGTVPLTMHGGQSP
jgi:hypothetical protein